MRLSEIMTAAVFTAAPQTGAIEVARMMRDHSVGSIVVVDHSEHPVAMVTDRDLALRVFAEGLPADSPVIDHASRPLVSGGPEMELEEAAALMVRHRVRRLAVVGADRLRGIVTLDDIAVRSGDLEVAHKMTQDVIQGALPQFYFHERG